MKTIAVIGASADPSKFGNRCVRTYLAHGYTVYPVNPKTQLIENLKVYRSISEIPADHLDRVSVYLSPELGMKVVEEIARKSVGELWLNPGAESDELIEKAESLGLKVIAACSIVHAD